MKLCSTPDCENPVEGNTEMCGTHNFQARKELRNSKKITVVKTPNKVSPKRAKENQEYLKLRDEYLIAYPSCEVEDCHNRATSIHHMKGRENGLLLDVKYFLAVCQDCHTKITTDSNWAVNNGYSILRTAKI